MRNMTPPIIPKLSNALDTSNFRQFDDQRLDMDNEHGLGPDDLNAADPFREFESSTFFSCVALLRSGLCCWFARVAHAMVSLRLCLRVALPQCR